MIALTEVSIKVGEAQAQSPTALRGTLNPLRSLYRWAIRRRLVLHNPVTGVDLPSMEGRRVRIADGAEAGRLLAALPAQDRRIWATALYAGLRLGEIQALRKSAVDLGGGLIFVDGSWERRGRVFVRTKSRSGDRRVPIAGVLRPYIEECVTDEMPDNTLVFSGRPDIPLSAEAARRRAKGAWRAAGFEPIGFYECRHTFASLMLAAGVVPLPLSRMLGHSTISITLDLYGHLMPGAEAAAAQLLDNYVDGATEE